MKLSPLILLSLLLPSCFVQICAQEKPKPDLAEIGQWETFEKTFPNPRTYHNPFRDVELKIILINRQGERVSFWGFYDGSQTWKVRFMPTVLGKWDYEAWFSDRPAEKYQGSFRCVASEANGLVTQDIYNPYWLGYQSGASQLFRSFHVGDCFFAQNWDDPNNPNDGEKRTGFLDWAEEQGYNMLSVASHYLNRQEKGRGEGWDTPQLWPLNPEEYRKMETILDELHQRHITVFPFAGFFGAKGNWPTDPEDQELYIKYTLARIGHYPHVILNVGGPEPLYRKNPSQYQSAMKLKDLLRLGELIDRLDVHRHILTVHHSKTASQYGDPLIAEPWYDMTTLQGPTTLDREELFSHLLMNHHSRKPLFAQETLWSGNKWHPPYSDEQLRKNAWVILFSGAILNFADMDGNSSTGFSGEPDLSKKNQNRHDIVKQVWDRFEEISFERMIPRQDLLHKNQGYCLAREGEEYYVYLDTAGKAQLFVDYPYAFQSEWINPKDFSDIRSGPSIRKETLLESPSEGSDWLLHVFAPKPARVAQGNFPDIARDSQGNLHLVYNRDGLKYRKYQAPSQRWGEEESPGCDCENVQRSDPDVVVDSKGNPYVFCGSEFAYWNGSKWVKLNPGAGARRDSELAMDSKDAVYLSYRAFDQEGMIGLKKLDAERKAWVDLPNPDLGSSGHNNHVYPDLFIDQEDQLHLVQRHGGPQEITYRRSEDEGKSWPVATGISDERGEGPHLAVDGKGKIYISTGKGWVYEKNGEKWDSLGRLMPVESRHQPELSVDAQDNIYLAAFGGQYRTVDQGRWQALQKLPKQSKAATIGFVETIGADDFAYIIWEEGEGDANGGLDAATSQIYVAKLYPDGRVIGLVNGEEDKQEP